MNKVLLAASPIPNGVSNACVGTETMDTDTNADERYSQLQMDHASTYCLYGILTRVGRIMLSILSTKQQWMNGKAASYRSELHTPKLHNGVNGMILTSDAALDPNFDIA